MVLFDTRGGKPFTYLLGRGRLYVQGDVTRYSGGVAQTASTGWRDVGNVTNFTISQESETKEHRSSLSGIQIVDLEVPVSQKMIVTFAVDEINQHNLARFFSGELLTSELGYVLANASAIASDDSSIASGNRNFFVDTATTHQVYDMWYNLELNLPTSGSITAGLYRAIDFEANASQAITVRKAVTNNTDISGGTLLTEGTHYELDRKMGRIRFISSGAGGLQLGDTFLVRWAAPTTPKSATSMADDKLFMIKPLTTSGVSVSLMFISENPNDSDSQAALELFKVKLKPDGEFAGIGDDWAALSFTGALESITNPPPGASAYGRWVGRTAYSTT